MPNLTPKEQDEVLKVAAQCKQPPFIHSKIVAARRRRHADPVDITTIRRAMRGKTHQLDGIETRGRKRAWTRANVFQANKVGKDNIKKHHPKYVKWDNVVKSSRAPQIHRSTAQRSFKRKGINVLFRPCREKPQLTTEHIHERGEICGVLVRNQLSTLRMISLGIS